MDIIAGISAVSQALDIAKKLRELEKQYNDAELKLQIANLQSALADAKLALSDAKLQLQERDAEIRRLSEVQSDKFSTVRYHGYNFGIDENGKSIGRPFCPVCEKKSGLQIQIVRTNSRIDTCPSCKAVYSDYPWRLPSEYEPTKED